MVKETFVVLSIAMEHADVPMLEWEPLGKALVQIHEAEVELHWVEVA